MVHIRAFGTCLTQVEPYKKYVSITRMPFTTLSFTHTITEISRSQVEISHLVEIKGLLTPILRFTLGKKLKKRLPLAVNGLANQAETS
jgi:hypothetical protein